MEQRPDQTAPRVKFWDGQRGIHTRKALDLWAGSCQWIPWGEETQGTLHCFPFHFELDFFAVFLIASDSSSVYVLLGCMTSEVCVPGRRELWRNAKERAVQCD